jgi:hypothetical protein
MSTTPGPVQEVLGRLDGVTGGGKQWAARCPAHEDDRASLSVSVGKDGCVLLKCHAGCGVDAVLDALGLKIADLFPPHEGNGRPRIVAEYDYRDQSGHLLFQTVRYVPKDFRQRRPDGKGGWAWNLDGVPRVLYRLPELLVAPPEQPAFIVVGEKDVDRLCGLGLVATCSPMGAGKGKWRRGIHTEPLQGRIVYVIPDNDDPGRQHAAAVLASLQCVARSAVLVELPGLPPKGDVSDWLNVNGDDKERLLGLCRQAAEQGQGARGRSAQAAPPPGGKADRTRSAYVRRLYTENPSWLEQCSCVPVYQRYLHDHPGGSEAPRNFQDIVRSVKCQLRREKKAKKDRGRRDAAGAAGVSVSTSYRAGTETETATGPSWPDSVPLSDGPEAPPFPLEVLPGPMRRLAEEIARAVNCPVDYPAVYVLGLAGGAVGNSRHVAVKHGHTQAPCLFVVTVGSPGTAKSPPLKMLRKPFDQVQADHRADHKQKMADWSLQDAEARGPKPTLKQCVVSDTTTETLAAILDVNPRGVAMVRDELSGLVAGLNQYKGGSGHDRQVYLQLWAGDTVQIDRKSDKDGQQRLVINPFVSICGGTQPSVLASFRGDGRRGAPAADDGWIDRFLFAYPAQVPAAAETWDDVSPGTMSFWDKVVRHLLSLQMVKEEDGRVRPFLVRLDEGGRQAWQEFTSAHAKELNDEGFPDHLRGPWAKMTGYCARLALVLHFLGWACEHDEDGVRSPWHAGGGRDKDDVGADSVADAARLVTYFKAHAAKAHAAMDGDRRLAGARRVWDWVVRERRAEFKRWEAHNDLKSQKEFPTPDSLDPVLELLCQHNLIRVRVEAQRQGPGRRPEPVYEVNPSALGPSGKSKESGE